MNKVEYANYIEEHFHDKPFYVKVKFAFEYISDKDIVASSHLIRQIRSWLADNKELRLPPNQIEELFELYKEGIKLSGYREEGRLTLVDHEALYANCTSLLNSICKILDGSEKMYEDVIVRIISENPTHTSPYIMNLDKYNVLMKIFKTKTTNINRWMYFLLIAVSLDNYKLIIDFVDYIDIPYTVFGHVIAQNPTYIRYIKNVSNLKYS